MSARYFSVLAIVTVVCVAPIASADKAKAEEHYKRGHTAYQLGKFDDAIKLFTAAFEEEPDPEYLYALAGAHRLATNYERAAFFYRRYLGLVPNPPNKPEIDGWLVQLDKAAADKIAADKVEAARIAAEQARLAKIAADQAEAAKLKAEEEARKARESGLNKRVRISVEAGLSVIYLRDIEPDPRAPALGGRIAVSWIKRVGGFTIDLGGVWLITTIPYTATDGVQTSVFFTQLHGTASVLHGIVGPVWGRAGIGLGGSTFSNLNAGNPITMTGSPTVRMLCARLDTTVGYRYSPTIDFVLGVASGSISARARAAPMLGQTLTYEGGYLGVYIKL